MTDPSPCRFCETETANRFSGETFPVCEDCEQFVKELVGSWMGEESDTAFGFDPVGYDYTPESGELMYLATQKQFYEIEVRTEQGQKIIFLQPIPRNVQAIPITKIRMEIGEAIANGDFYRVTVNGTGILDRTAWWESAMALAPSPHETQESKSTTGATTTTPEEPITPTGTAPDSGKTDTPVAASTDETDDSTLDEPIPEQEDLEESPSTETELDLD